MLGYYFLNSWNRWADWWESFIGNCLSSIRSFHSFDWHLCVIREVMYYLTKLLNAKKVLYLPTIWCSSRHRRVDPISHVISCRLGGGAGVYSLKRPRLFGSFRARQHFVVGNSAVISLRAHWQSQLDSYSDGG